MKDLHSRKFVFLDRDGVINRDSPDYIKNWSEFHFLPGSLKALALLKENGYNVVVITNQSIIGRKMVEPHILQNTHDNMRRVAAENGGEIREIFFCPHTPDDHCDCRKPKPGLLHQARDAFGLDLSNHAMIGDSAKDILAARAAGCGMALLVGTGNGEAALEDLRRKGVEPDYAANDLLDAVKWLLARDKEASGGLHA
ncbi:D-glycero-beta-D-manno-heptose 1,7-bisphosphate 7-phosphatase [Desulfatibacillum aliphaticivorans]|uniref:D-glycero-beta-D-manno-heptose 1,7-bisphosphate 7-phosphatase n=1 Tax=Desulfatibacillum aliphaticivorans TaxID=218208 RepID=UPI0004828E7B|nr:D-glycero-beta-D-manno-heptose 1,7-bisphosphate 7-phosphatase [Desulfatibacillum aliphaticivorans]